MNKIHPIFKLSGKSLIKLPKINGYVIRLKMGSNYKVKSSSDFDGDGWSFFRRIDSRCNCSIRTTTNKGIRFFKRMRHAIKKLASIRIKYPGIYGEVLPVRIIGNINSSNISS